MTQIAAESLQVGVSSIQMVVGDTSQTPDSPITAGSTVTFSSGRAIISAATGLKKKLILEASEHFGVSTAELNFWGTKIGQSEELSVSVSDLVSATGEKMSATETIEPGSADHIINSFGAHFVRLEVDESAGSVRIIQYVAVHDSGTIINPTLAQAKVRGGISQMLGYTFTEDMIIDKATGIVLNANYLDHKSPTIWEIPEIDVAFVGIDDPVGPYGAKSLGEPPSIGPAPAIANAIYDATGKRYLYLPISIDKILRNSGL